MNVKFYKNLFRTATTIIALLAGNLFATAQQQGLSITSVSYTATTATVYVKSVSLTNIIGLQGTITFDKNSLQFVSATSGSNISTLSGQYNGSNANGTITYLISEPNVNTVSIATDTIMFRVLFNVINNPQNTYNNAAIEFSNSPLSLEVDTTDIGSGLPVQVLYPTLANHTGGIIQFARPPYLTYTGGDIVDTVTNRPPGCTYQWFESGNPVAGPNSSTYPGAPAGTYTLQVTYPNTVVVSSVNAVLPVKLSKFSGAKNDNVNVLSWATASAVNTSNFEIERSEDSKSFSRIGKLAAINSNKEENYSFSDANTNGKTLYYRLKINDNNGSFGYSNVIRISNDTKATIAVYPNPAKDIVNISGNKMQQITVTNLIGKIVLQKELGSVNNTTINTANLAQGVYNVNILSASGRTNVKLVVE